MEQLSLVTIPYLVSYCLPLTNENLDRIHMLHAGSPFQRSERKKWIHCCKSVASISSAWRWASMIWSRPRRTGQSKRRSTANRTSTSREKSTSAFSSAALADRDFLGRLTSCKESTSAMLSAILAMTFSIARLISMINTHTSEDVVFTTESTRSSESDGGAVGIQLRERYWLANSKLLLS